MTARILLIAGLCAFALSAPGCGAYVNQVTFPSADDLFITTGDGNIQKPYTPLGQLIYSRRGFRIPLPLFGLIPVNDVDPSVELRKGILQNVKKMGGDGVINLSMIWNPPTDGFLGFFANGGEITIYGTVIKR